MSSSSLVETSNGSANGSTVSVPPRSGPQLQAIIALSAWCGLVAGLLEVAALLLRKRLFDADQILSLSHHFVWLIPVANLCIFIALAVIGFTVVRIWPHRGRWVFSHTLAALTVLPPLLSAFPKIYSIALMLIAAGIAVRIVPIIERNRWRFQPFFLPGYLVPLTIVAILAGSSGIAIVQTGRRKRQPLPPPGSPNVLLLVLDTVASSHASVNGYNRATTNTLTELATRGIRFDCADPRPHGRFRHMRACLQAGGFMNSRLAGSPRWIAKNPRSPSSLETTATQPPASLPIRGTAASSSGLSRGFTHYEDHIFPSLTTLKTCAMVARALDNYEVVIHFTKDTLQSIGLL